MPRATPAHEQVDGVNADTLMNWHVLVLGDSLANATTLDRIASEFALLYRGREHTAAVLQRLDTSHSLHCEVTVYFSPGAATLAQAFQATACSRPDPRGLTALAGTWSLTQAD